MTRVGFTGHQHRPGVSWVWVRAELESTIGNLGEPIIGLTCLAAGADQIFAEVILQLRGSLEAVVPFDTYPETFASEQDRTRFVRLLGQAVRRVDLHLCGSVEENYLAAGRFIVDRSQLLIAVWDREPAKGLGGTADIVRYARDQERILYVIDPVSEQVSIPDDD